MEKFSQRMGIQQENAALQRDSMGVGLKNVLWNVFDDRVRWGMPSYYARKCGEQIWKYCFSKILDGAPSVDINKLFEAIKQHYLTLEWNEVYDFIEFVANRLDSDDSIKFVEDCNSALQGELSAYRFVEKKLVPVTSELEITEVEEAIRTSKQFTQHLERAVELLADKKAPDYRNSIKESISAVEAMCQLITGNKKATLGDGLRQLERVLGHIKCACLLPLTTDSTSVQKR
jgi:hypothetical protein